MDNVPVNYRTVDECHCAEIVLAGGGAPASPPTISKVALEAIDLPKFGEAFDKVAAEHRVKPGNKRKLCPMCEMLGSTIGCLKCNGAFTNIKW